METTQEIFGWLAAWFTICYYVSPTPQYYNVLKGKTNFEETPGFFVSTCYVNCFIWYVYGDMIFSDQLQYSHMAGAGISLFLMVIYLIYELKKYLVDSILNALIIFTGTWAVYRALTIIIDDDRVVGKIGFGTTIIVFITPIQNLYKVIKDKNYILIPICSTWIYLLSCITWVVYGIFISDFYIICTHCTGIILSLIQIVVFYNFKRKYPVIGEKDFTSTIDIVKTGNEDNKNEETTVKIDDDENNTKIKEKPVKIVSKAES